MRPPPPKPFLSPLFRFPALALPGRPKMATESSTALPGSCRALQTSVGMAFTCVYGLRASTAPRLPLATLASRPLTPPSLPENNLALTYLRTEARDKPTACPSKPRETLAIVEQSRCRPGTAGFINASARPKPRLASLGEDSISSRSASQCDFVRAFPP